MNEKEKDAIEVRPSEINPGRWSFYINGERCGSAMGRGRAWIAARAFRAERDKLRRAALARESDAQHGE